MKPPRPPRRGPQLDPLIGLSLDRIDSCFDQRPDPWILVDCAGQALWLVREGVPRQGWWVSTALHGLDNRDGSGGTPPGVHRIAGKIGAGAAPGTVFVSREPTGEVWTPASAADGDPDDPDDRDLILTRILLLDGCEEGLNRGDGIDSRARYIYVHGTNHETQLGRPASHGCVRMAGEDIIELFDQVEEGAPLVII